MDVFSTRQRSAVMAKVRAKNTAPEMLVRSLLHGLGYRFRLHRRDLPGSPDLTLSKFRTVVFVHGCFWHQHLGCKRADRPTSNRQYWNKKLDRNIARDTENAHLLKGLGWKVIIVWECQTKDKSRLTRRLVKALGKVQ